NDGGHPGAVLTWSCTSTPQTQVVLAPTVTLRSCGKGVHGPARCVGTAGAESATPCALGLGGATLEPGPWGWRNRSELDSGILPTVAADGVHREQGDQ